MSVFRDANPSVATCIDFAGPALQAEIQDWLSAMRISNFVRQRLAYWRLLSEPTRE